METLFSGVLKTLSLLRITGTSMDHCEVPKDNVKDLSGVLSLPHPPCVLTHSKSNISLIGGCRHRRLSCQMMKVNPSCTKREPRQCLTAFPQITPTLAFGLVEDSFVPLSQICSLNIIYLAGITVGHK